MASGYRLLPGRHGITKGLSVGVLVWLIMGSVLFPLVGLGFLAFDVGLGFQPTLLSLTMVETYSAVMGTVFAFLNRDRSVTREREDLEHVPFWPIHFLKKPRRSQPLAEL